MQVLVLVLSLSVYQGKFRCVNRITVNILICEGALICSRKFVNAIQISGLNPPCPRRTGHLEVEFSEGYIQIYHKSPT